MLVDAQRPNHCPKQYARVVIAARTVAQTDLLQPSTIRLDRRFRY